MSNPKGLKNLNDITEEFCELIDNIADLKGGDKPMSAADAKNVKNYDLSRPIATKVVWLYIKEQDLQNPENGREILCDSTLKAMSGKNKITMFEIGKMLNNHLIDKQ